MKRIAKQNYPKAKRFCEKLEKLNYLIKNKQYELQEVRAKAGHIPSNGFHERIQTTRTNDKIETGIINRLETEKRLQGEIEALFIERQNKTKILEELKTISYDILYKRFVNGYDFYKIMEIYDRTYSCINMRQWQAMKELEELLTAKETAHKPTE